MRAHPPIRPLPAPLLRLLDTLAPPRWLWRTVGALAMGGQVLWRITQGARVLVWRRSAWAGRRAGVAKPPPSTRQAHRGVKVGDGAPHPPHPSHPTHPLPGKIHWRNTAEQLRLVGPRSLGVSLLTAGFVGMVFTIQFVREFARLGLTRSVGGVLGLALSRELTPVVTSIILAGRVGSAFAAELGTMAVSEQTDSLRVLGSDPLDYLVTPRVLACMVAGPVLNVLCFLMGMAASTLLAEVVYDVSANVILDSAARAVMPWDVVTRRAGCGRGVGAGSVGSGGGRERGVWVRAGVAGLEWVWATPHIQLDWVAGGAAAGCVAAWRGGRASARARAAHRPPTPARPPSLPTAAASSRGCLASSSRSSPAPGASPPAAAPRAWASPRRARW